MAPQLFTIKKRATFVHIRDNGVFIRSNNLNVQKLINQDLECRSRGRGRVWRSAAGDRIHDVQFRHAGHRPDHQLCRQDAVYVRRPDGVPDCLSRPERCRQPRRRSAFAMLCQLVRALPWPESGVAMVGRRRQGSAEGRDPRPEPGHLPRERGNVRAELRGADR